MWLGPRLAFHRRPGAAFLITVSLASLSMFPRRLFAFNDLIDARAVQSHGFGNLAEGGPGFMRSLEALATGGSGVIDGALERHLCLARRFEGFLLRRVHRPETMRLVASPHRVMAPCQPFRTYSRSLERPTRRQNRQA